MTKDENFSVFFFCGLTHTHTHTHTFTSNEGDFSSAVIFSFFFSFFFFPGCHRIPQHNLCCSRQSRCRLQPKKKKKKKKKKKFFFFFFFFFFFWGFLPPQQKAFSMRLHSISVKVSRRILVVALFVVCS